MLTFGLGFLQESCGKECGVLRFIGGAIALVLGLCAVTVHAEPAKNLFGAQRTPAAMPPQALGAYAQGCLAGGVELPETGWGWQAMRLSRNRNWGHPSAIAFVERLASRAQTIGWIGLYIGDISQPRGGPMRSGHRSHQLGLDIDIWMRQPTRLDLSRAERERIGSPKVVTNFRINRYWTSGHHQLLKAAAEDLGVARIFVHPAIKQQLCQAEPLDDREWLGKIRPWWGHDAHFHVRLNCPPESPDCVAQPQIPPGDGCNETLAWWFSEEARNPKPASPGKPRGQLTLDDLPLSCAGVLAQ